MSTPNYVVKKIGDRYMPVLEDPYPRITRATYIGWSGLLFCLGSHRRGMTKTLLCLSGIALAAHVACDCDWVSNLRAAWADRDRGRDGKRSQSPSHQHHDASGRRSQVASDVVEEQAMESFPASDPPARTASHA